MKLNDPSENNKPSGAPQSTDDSPLEKVPANRQDASFNEGPGMTHRPQNDSSQTIGKNMLIIAWVLALVVLTWIFGMWEDNQVNPNRSPDTSYSEQATEVALKRNRYGHYLTNGEINNQSVIFLVDTGASDVAIPQELQQELGLEAGQAHYAKTANGTTKGYNTRIRQLSIGGIKLYDVRASIIPNMEGREILLGMSVLNQLEFTQRGNELTLRQIH